MPSLLESKVGENHKNKLEVPRSHNKKLKPYFKHEELYRLNYTLGSYGCPHFVTDYHCQKIFLAVLHYQKFFFFACRRLKLTVCS